MGAETTATMGMFMVLYSVFFIVLSAQAALNDRDLPVFLPRHGH